MSVRDLGTVSIRRNEIVSDLFFRLHKVERIGMGIWKRKDAMIAAGLREPTFKPNGFFRVIFHRSPEFAMKEGMPGAADTGKKVRVKTAQKIIALIRNHPEITRHELAMEFAITDSGVKYHLKKLQDKGLLRRVGPDKGGYW